MCDSYILPVQINSKFNIFIFLGGSIQLTFDIITTEKWNLCISLNLRLAIFEETSNWKSSMNKVVYWHIAIFESTKSVCSYDCCFCLLWKRSFLPNYWRGNFIPNIRLKWVKRDELFWRDGNEQQTRWLLLFIQRNWKS